jgi:hypothetical protein
VSHYYPPQLPGSLRMYVVTYQLAGLLRDSKPLDAILQGAGEWWHYMDRVWLIYTSDAANDLYNRLVPALQENDRLFITQITRQADYQGWLPAEAWAWINERQRPGVPQYRTRW